MTGLYPRPLLFDLPMPIQTDRLILRPVMAGDGKKIFEAVEESRSLFRTWMPWVDDVKDWRDSEETARRFHAEFILRKNLNVAFLKGDGLVGIGGFNHLNWERGIADIGYWCRIYEQKNGYVREAIAALTKYAFEWMKFRRLTITCDAANESSCRVAESLGFTLEVEARGIIATPFKEELALGRKYVRFDAKGLGNYKALWSSKNTFSQGNSPCA